MFYTFDDVYALILEARLNGTILVPVRNTEIQTEICWEALESNESTKLLSFLSLANETGISKIWIFTICEGDKLKLQVAFSGYEEIYAEVVAEYYYSSSSRASSLAFLLELETLMNVTGNKIIVSNLNGTFREVLKGFNGTGVSWQAMEGVLTLISLYRNKTTLWPLILTQEEVGV
jgi:hypothetical protein